MDSVYKEGIISVFMGENQKFMIIVTVLRQHAAKTYHVNKWQLLSGHALIFIQIKTMPRQSALKTNFNVEIEIIFNFKALRMLVFK